MTHVLVIPSWYPTPRAPAPGSFFREQAQALHRGGHRVGVLAPVQRSLRHWRGSHDHCRWIDDQGVATLRHDVWRWLPGANRLHARGWVAAGVRLFHRYVARCGVPDLLHAQGALYGGVLAARISGESHIRYVVSEHHSIYITGRLARWQRQWATDAVRHAAVRTVVSPELGQAMEQALGEAMIDWQWVPNMVDPRFTLPASAAAGDEFTFITVGQLAVSKGLLDLLAAFAQAFAGRREVRLRLVGEGPLRATLTQRIESLRLSGQVDLAGQLTREQTAEAMRQADCLVVASHYETFGVTLIEAMACGKPVIATACGGPRHIVTAEAGLLVPPRDPGQLAQALARMVHTRAGYDARAIRDGCLARYSEEVVVRQWNEVYRQALGVKPR